MARRFQANGGMTIICGVDFSDASRVAVRAAAALASRNREKIILVHAAESLEGHGNDAQLLALQREKLNRSASALRASTGEIESLVVAGVPDEVLLEASRQHAARCIVVGAFGHRKRRTSEIGSHADRLAQHSHLPVLVVRDAAPFEAWARGERSLKIMLGVDLSSEALRAVSWVAELSRLGPCDVTAIHLYWPPTEWSRVGLSGIREILAPAPEVTQAIERELEFCRTALSDAVRFDLHVEPSLGSHGSRLAELATDRDADLIVVGTHARGALRRLWEGSVSRSLLEYASVAVACVPDELGAKSVVSGGAGSVLCATDFSPVGNAAIPVAYQLVGPGGTVSIVHATSWAHDPYVPHDIFDGGPESNAISKRLAALVPESLASRIATDFYSLRAPDPAQAICQAAERLGVGTICIGTHGRAGFSRTVLGSIAAGVLANTGRRVVLVRPTRGKEELP